MVSLTRSLGANLAARHRQEVDGNVFLVLPY